MDNEGQLNISTPILSVRRHLDRVWPATKNSPRGSGTRLSLLLDRLEWESEEVSKAAAVPFQWERAPGRPKRDSLYHSDKEPSITPRPPPGKLFEICSPRPPSGIHNAQNLSGEAFRSSRLVIPGRKFGEIFSPRLRPGRLDGLKHVAGEVRTPKLTSLRLSDILNISCGKSWVQNNMKCQAEAFTTTDHAPLLESFKDCLGADWESDKDKGDDASSHALHSSSPNESSSLNSSVSGFSSSYYKNCGSSGNFSVDLQARSFMINRFLPAAEAAVVHTPRQVPKKPTVVIGKTVNKVVHSQRKSLMKQPGINARPSNNQHMEYLEIDNEDVEYDDPKIRMGKTRGIFHRLCGNNYVSRSNKKPGRKLKTKPSQLSSREVNKLTRNAYSGPEINPLVRRYKPTQSSNNQGFQPKVVAVENAMYVNTLRKKVTDMNLYSSKSGRPSNPMTKKWKTMAGSEAVYDFGSTWMESTSTCNSKLPGILPIMDEFNQEDKNLGTVEPEGRKTW
ncbi:hypothetical protein LIER_18354 [Lithospermum erythrorhizon]|uniref:DUF3741 domain-containing protein n=1 Tax=Lithospermum erythrorhizon TaxID=34254 RepID=A0AAV3QGH2_LITER